MGASVAAAAAAAATAVAAAAADFSWPKAKKAASCIKRYVIYSIWQNLLYTYLNWIWTLKSSRL